MKEKRGFAAMTPAQRSKIASMGGKAAQRNGKAHRWTAEKAAEAGHKGGKVAQDSGTGNRFDSESGRKAASSRKKQVAAKRRGKR